MRLKNLITVPRFTSSNLVVVYTKSGSAANVASLVQVQGSGRDHSGPAGGTPGSGAGKGGGAGGTIRESGGSMGQFGAAQEEGYFYNRSKEQLEKIKKRKEQKSKEEKDNEDDKP